MTLRKRDIPGWVIVLAVGLVSFLAMFGLAPVAKSWNDADKPFIEYDRMD